MIEVQKHLIFDKFLMSLVTKLFSLVEGAVPTKEELSDFVRFCCHAYARMRGKDYVRRVLGRKTKKRAGIA